MKGYNKHEINVRLLVASLMIAGGLALAVNKIIHFIQ